MRKIVLVLVVFLYSGWLTASDVEMESKNNSSEAEGCSDGYESDTESDGELTLRKTRKKIHTLFQGLQIARPIAVTQRERKQ